MEKSKKLMWRSRPQLRTFILFPAAKGGGGKEQERAKRREGGEGTRKRTPRTLRNTQRTV